MYLLGWEDDGDVGAIHGPHAVGETHARKAADHLLQLRRQMKWFSRIFLVNQRHCLDGLSSRGLTSTKLVGDIVETAGNGQLHEGGGHLLLQHEG